MKIFIEIFGWYGAIAILTAYFLISFAVINPESIWYQLLNLTGAIGLLGISFYKRAYQPAALNIIWIIIALIALANILI